MVSITEQQRVAETRLASVDPMHHVMGVEPFAVRASWIAATTIPRQQRTAQRGLHHAVLAPDIERIALGVLRHRHHTRIAAQTAHGFERRHHQLECLATTGI